MPKVALLLPRYHVSDLPKRSSLTFREVPLSVADPYSLTTTRAARTVGSAVALTRTAPERRADAARKAFIWVRAIVTSFGNDYTPVRYRECSVDDLSIVPNCQPIHNAHGLKGFVLAIPDAGSL